SAGRGTAVSREDRGVSAFGSRTERDVFGERSVECVSGRSRPARRSAGTVVVPVAAVAVAAVTVAAVTVAAVTAVAVLALSIVRGRSAIAAAAPAATSAAT